MTGPPPDNRRDTTGNDPGRPAVPPAPIEPRVPPISPQQYREYDLVAPDTHQSAVNMDMDGDRDLPSHPSKKMAARPGLTSCASDRVPTQLPYRVRKMSPGFLNDWIRGSRFTSKAQGSFRNGPRPLLLMTTTISMQP
ncbi:unnamed protein product [Peronospora belbahrii]|uniref:Uncharacterized protein n=1 Tax=Peronospora belbahrii TaxID=622444 RepID=A0ABN8DE75_9STRA|nr:unnamed protein product [Peronospora belbahrii]